MSFLPPLGGEPSAIPDEAALEMAEKSPEPVPTTIGLRANVASGRISTSQPTARPLPARVVITQGHHASDREVPEQESTWRILFYGLAAGALLLPIYRRHRGKRSGSLITLSLEE